MPELPEVETVRRGLEPVLVGHRFRRVEQRRADLRFPLPERFVERLVGRSVERLERRAKYILAHIDSGEVLVIHLGMTGRFTIARRGSTSRCRIGEFELETGSEPRHDHVVFEMSQGAVITYNDARRFGLMTLVATDRLAEHPYFSRLGIEPLGAGLTAQSLAAAANGRRTDLKAFLMDQRIVAGLGNIYVCEALFRAGLSPRRRSGTLALRGGTPAKRAHSLTSAIRVVLEQAIAAGGSTLRDYKQADGSLGEFQMRFQVYAREGERCPRPGCGGTVRRIVQSGRSTFYCPRCQF